MSKKVLYFIYFVLFWIIVGFVALIIPGPLPENALVNIPKGESVLAIADNLTKRRVIRNKYFFAYAMRVLGLDKSLVVGEFNIPAHSNMLSIINHFINSKKRYIRKIIIPEGLTVKQIYAILLSNPYLSGGLPWGVKEGSLMPDTYYFYKGESKVDILNRMQAQMNKYVNELWAKRDYSLPYQTKQEAIILASIVEKETASPVERPVIARVFLNRLKLGMRLQSDPTVAYGLHIKDAKLLTKKDLSRKNPYNTYTIKGLPYGAIANPGRASLYAVFHPANNNYLYFVAHGNGRHKFSSTLTQHNLYVAQWKEYLNKNS